MSEKQFDVYQHQADIYPRLVTCEDVEDNLKKLLLTQLDFEDKIVIEASIGTGRVTQIYLDKVGQVLAHPLVSDKLHLQQATHAEIPTVVCIETLGTFRAFFGKTWQNKSKLSN